MKNIMIILLLGLATSCYIGTEREELVSDCKDSLPHHKTVSDLTGTAEKTEVLEYTLSMALNSFKLLRSLSNRNTTIACSVKTCKEGNTRYSVIRSLDDQWICLPDPDSCSELLLKNIPGSDHKVIEVLSSLTTLNQIYWHRTKNTAECVQQPFSCSEGFSIDSTNREALSCTISSIPCSGEDISIGIAAGVKNWDTESNEYGQCQITSCSENYTLAMNKCVENGPPAANGCMDSRADNFNSSATIDDQSCLCDPYYSSPYNPITGCEEGEVN